MIKYEWTVELVDHVGDIIDSDFSDTLAGLPKWFAASNNKIEIGLVRNEGNEVDGVTDRFWAYVKDGKLPEYFSDSQHPVNIKVPQRFHIELSKQLISV